MLETGMFQRDVGTLRLALESGRRADLGATAPACGLTLSPG